MSTTPTVFLDDQFGNKLVAIPDWISLDYSRAENSVGALVLVVPAQNYSRSLFYKDGVIEVWRQNAAGIPYLDTGTVWMIRRIKYSSDPPARWEITAYDLNHLLTRRVVDYNPGNTFTEKLAAADDMGKQIVSENFGAGATDATRSIATYLSIQANLTAAPVVRKSISRQQVFKVLQDIASASYQSGTYLVFDIIVSQLTSPVSTLKYEFRSYTKQRGTDHTFTTGSNPSYIGPDFGNLTNGILDEDASAEITRGISTGQGVDTAQAVARQDDLARQAESPFGLIEATRSASAALVAADLIADAQAELRQGIPTVTLNGKVITVPGLQYGVNWNWGDLLPIQVNGRVINCHVPVVHVKYDDKGVEIVEPTLVAAVS